MNPPIPANAHPVDQAVLFRYHHGDRIRLMARTASVLGLLVTLTAGGVVARAIATHGLLQLAPGALVIGSIVALSGAGFALLACRFSRQFVTHLEIWPRSNLVVVRTAGCCREQIRLLGWTEFRTGNFSVGFSHHDPLLRVHTRSGQRLAFDQDRGEAPHGWVALHRFLERCSVPESTTLETAAPTQTTLPHHELEPQQA